MRQWSFIMRSRNFWQSTACALLFSLAALTAHSGDGNVQTGWMELIKGSRDSTVGAEVVEVEAGDSADTQKITLAIPKKSIAHPDDIEEVVVIGQRPEKPEKPEPLDITFEWAADLDSENYGLVIRLRRNTNWPIRLYMNSDPGFVR
jgi:hypothetical protein